MTRCRRNALFRKIHVNWSNHNKYYIIIHLRKTIFYIIKRSCRSTDYSLLWWINVIVCRMLTHYLLYLFPFFLGFIWNASVFPDRVTMEDNNTTISVIGNSSGKVLSCDVFIEQNHSQFDFTNGMFHGILYNLLVNIFVSAVGCFCQ